MQLVTTTYMYVGEKENEVRAGRATVVCLFLHFFSLKLFFPPFKEKMMQFFGSYERKSHSITKEHLEIFEVESFFLVASDTLFYTETPFNKCLIKRQE